MISGKSLHHIRCEISVASRESRSSSCTSVYSKLLNSLRMLASSRKSHLTRVSSWLELSWMSANGRSGFIQHFVARVTSANSAFYTLVREHIQRLRVGGVNAYPFEHEVANRSRANSHTEKESTCFTLQFVHEIAEFRAPLPDNRQCYFMANDCRWGIRKRQIQT